jgi:hypothetical protein
VNAFNRYKRLHGPYHFQRRLRVGSRTTCLLRGDVTIKSVSAARIRWPRC